MRRGFSCFDFGERFKQEELYAYPNGYASFFIPAGAGFCRGNGKRRSARTIYSNNRRIFCMEPYVVKRLTYAASYELLKHLYYKKRISLEQLEELTVVMAECQVCDPIDSYNCVDKENP